MTYTREDILAMPAGRELDELVAEKVMGWKKGSPGWSDEESHWVAHIVCVHVISKWCPSSDISAAWEVVDVYPVLKIEQVEIFKGNKSVKVTAWSGFDHHSEAEVTSKSAPEAICKAALLAVLEESP